MVNCYLCDRPAGHPLVLKKTFTAHNLAKNPRSDQMCDRCYQTMEGDQSQLWYWNEGKGRYSKVWGRSLSRLYIGEELRSPAIGRKRTEQDTELHEVSALPTRADIREWLINPPEPPFTIVIAESGQKHILFLAQQALNRDYFPVQFELDAVWCDRAEFTTLLNAYEELLVLGFSKTEIDDGKYRSDRLLKVFDQWQQLEPIIKPQRGGRLLQLCSFVAVCSRTKTHAK